MNTSYGPDLSAPAGPARPVPWSSQGPDRLTPTGKVVGSPVPIFRLMLAVSSGVEGVFSRVSGYLGSGGALLIERNSCSRTPTSTPDCITLPDLLVSIDFQSCTS